MGEDYFGSHLHLEFTGLDRTFPIELFIDLIENQTKDLSQICSVAMSQLSSNPTTPAGLWKASNGEFNDNQGNFQKDFNFWNNMKESLLGTFASREPYSVHHHLEFVQSLVKNDSENFLTYHNRVEWVIENVINLALPGNWGPEHSSQAWQPSTPLNAWCNGCEGELAAGATEWDQHESNAHTGNCLLCDAVISDLIEMRNHQVKAHNGMQMKCPKCQTEIQFQTDHTKECQKIVVAKSEINEKWARVIFLLGLKTADQQLALEKLEGKSLIELATILDGTQREIKEELELENEDGMIVHDGILENGYTDLENTNGVATDPKFQAIFTDEMVHITNKTKSEVLFQQGKNPAYLQCKRCPKSFRTQRQLHQHMKAHGKHNRFPCKLCNHHFMKESSLKKHEKSHFSQGQGTVQKFEDEAEASEKALPSNDVKAVLTVKLETEEQIFSENEREDIKASGDEGDDWEGIPVAKRRRTVKSKKPVIDKQKPVANKRRTFWKTQHGEGEINQEHSKWVEEVRIYVLKDGESLNNISSLSSQVKVMVGDIEKWICAYCQEEYSTLALLQTHSKKVHNGEIFRCTNCTKRCRRAINLALHMFAQHNIYIEGCSLKKYQCKYCEYETLRGYAISNHERIVHETNLVKCGVCSKEYKGEKNLKEHVESIHMKITQVTCDICQQVCSSKTTLGIHKRMKHSGFVHPTQQCPVCGEMIKMVTTMRLSEHMIRAHENFEFDKRSKEEQEKRFFCTHEGCRKMFFFAKDLKIHAKGSHEKSIPCPQCDMKFEAKGKHRLRKHILRHHMNLPTRKPIIKPFCCKSCENSYTTNKSLQIHIGTKHLGWPYEKAFTEYQILARTRPELWEKKDLLDAEKALLKGFLDDKYL